MDKLEPARQLDMPGDPVLQLLQRQGVRMLLLRAEHNAGAAAAHGR